MLNEEYYKRYKELYGLINQAYLDRGILEGIAEYQSVSKNQGYTLNNMSFLALQHICELSKADLALTIWKLTDSESKSNTIETLKTYLITQCGAKISAKLDKKTTKDLKNISTARNTYLAHNDLNKFGNTIKIEDMYAVLENIRQYFNQLCCQNVDERVECLTDIAVSLYKGKIGMGLHLLLLNSSNVPTEITN